MSTFMFFVTGILIGIFCVFLLMILFVEVFKKHPLFFFCKDKEPEEDSAGKKEEEKPEPAPEEEEEAGILGKSNTVLTKSEERQTASRENESSDETETDSSEEDDEEEESERKYTYDELLEKLRESERSYQSQTHFLQIQTEENQKLREERKNLLLEIESLGKAIRDRENNSARNDVQAESILKRIYSLTNRLDSIVEKIYAVEPDEIEDGSKFNNDEGTQMPEDKDTAESKDAEEKRDEKEVPEVSEAVPAAAGADNEQDFTSVSPRDVRRIGFLTSRKHLSHRENTELVNALSRISASVLLDSLKKYLNEHDRSFSQLMANAREDNESIINSRDTDDEMKKEAGRNMELIDSYIFAGMEEE